MPGANAFAKLVSVDDALEIFLEAVLPIGRTYRAELDFADNRVLSSAAIAPGDHPHFDQCVMDGYAVIAADTAGCSRERPVELRPVVGGRLAHGQCMPVHTGSALPEGADAVVRLEDAMAGDGAVRVLAEAPPGQHYTPRGSVVKGGGVVFPKGMQLKPTDIAMLASLGISGVEVYEKPRVLVIPTGDEIVERGRTAGPGQMNESNGLMCYLLVRRFGGKASLWDIVEDDVEKLGDALRGGLDYDLVVTTGGTSVGRRDHMHELVESMGRVLVHGVGLRPGRPLGLGYLEGDGRRVPIVFLPGVPDACAAGAMAFVGPAIRKMGRYPPLRFPADKPRLAGRLKVPPGTRSVSKVRVDAGTATPAGIVGPSPEGGEPAYVLLDGEADVEDAVVDAAYLE